MEPIFQKLLDTMAEADCGKLEYFAMSRFTATQMSRLLMAGDIPRGFGTTIMAITRHGQYHPRFLAGKPVKIVDDIMPYQFHLCTSAGDYHADIAAIA